MPPLPTHTHPSYRNELRASRRACRRRLWGYIGRAWRLPANMGNSCMTVLQFLCTWVQKWCENLSRKGSKLCAIWGQNRVPKMGRKMGPSLPARRAFPLLFLESPYHARLASLLPAGWPLQALPEWPLFTQPDWPLRSGPPAPEGQKTRPFFEADFVLNVVGPLMVNLERNGQTCPFSGAGWLDKKSSHFLKRPSSTPWPEKWPTPRPKNGRPRPKKRPTPWPRKRSTPWPKKWSRGSAQKTADALPPKTFDPLAPKRSTPRFMGAESLDEIGRRFWWKVSRDPPSHSLPLRGWVGPRWP